MAARSIQTIYDSIIAEKESNANLVALQPAPDSAQQFLTDLTSTSKVARWRLWVWLFAVAMWVHEVLWDINKAEVQAIVDAKEPGTTRWYYQEALKWQFGDQLVWTGAKYAYAAINEAAKLVKYCSVTEPGNFVLIKAAKQVSSLPAQLAAGELASLTAYLQQIKYAGVQVLVVSYSADQVRIYANIHYDPLVDLVALKVKVEAAINAFIIGLPFNSKFNLNALTDAIQAVDGVKDPRLTTVEYKYGALPYAAITGEYQTNAGYAEIDGSYPLSTTLTYIPDNV